MDPNAVLTVHRPEQAAYSKEAILSTNADRPRRATFLYNPDAREPRSKKSHERRGVTTPCQGAVCRAHPRSRGQKRINTTALSAATLFAAVLRLKAHPCFAVRIFWPMMIFLTSKLPPLSQYSRVQALRPCEEGRPATLVPSALFSLKQRMIRRARWS